MNRPPLTSVTQFLLRNHRVTIYDIMLLIVLYHEYLMEPERLAAVNTLPAISNALLFANKAVDLLRIPKDTTVSILAPKNMGTFDSWKDFLGIPLKNSSKKNNKNNTASNDKDFISVYEIVAMLLGSEEAVINFTKVVYELMRKQAHVDYMLRHNMSNSSQMMAALTEEDMQRMEKRALDQFNRLMGLRLSSAAALWNSEKGNNRNKENLTKIRTALGDRLKISKNADPSDLAAKVQTIAQVLRMHMVLGPLPEYDTIPVGDENKIVLSTLEPGKKMGIYRIPDDERNVFLQMVEEDGSATMNSNGMPILSVMRVSKERNSNKRMLRSIDIGYFKVYIMEFPMGLSPAMHVSPATLQTIMERMRQRNMERLMEMEMMEMNMMNEGKKKKKKNTTNANVSANVPAPANNANQMMGGLIKKKTMRSKKSTRKSTKKSTKKSVSKSKKRTTKTRKHSKH
jgi:hypothetical protein